MMTSHPNTHSERGSVTVWLVMASFAMILIIGIAVDMSGQIHTQQRAQDIAAQAARVAGEQVATGPAMTGDPTRVDVAAAKAAARRYLTAAGVTGAVTVTSPTTLTVTCATTYQPVFLGIIGIQQLTVTGTSTARLVRAVEGAER